jgi:hypothetical protein
MQRLLFNDVLSSVDSVREFRIYSRAAAVADIAMVTFL